MLFDRRLQGSSESLFVAHSASNGRSRYVINGDVTNSINNIHDVINVDMNFDDNVLFIERYRFMSK